MDRSFRSNSERSANARSRRRAVNANHLAPYRGGTSDLCSADRPGRPCAAQRRAPAGRRRPFDATWPREACRARATALRDRLPRPPAGRAAGLALARWPPRPRRGACWPSTIRRSSPSCATAAWTEVSLTPPRLIDLAAAEALGDRGCRFDATSSAPVRRTAAAPRDWLAKGAATAGAFSAAAPMAPGTAAPSRCWRMAAGIRPPRRSVARLLLVLERPAPPPQDQLQWSQHGDACEHLQHLETYTLSQAHAGRPARELEGQRIIACYYRNDDPATHTAARHAWPPGLARHASLPVRARRGLAPDDVAPARGGRPAATDPARTRCGRSRAGTGARARWKTQPLSARPEATPCAPAASARIEGIDARRRCASAGGAKVVQATRPPARPGCGTHDIERQAFDARPRAVAARRSNGCASSANASRRSARAEGCPAGSGTGNAQPCLRHEKHIRHNASKQRRQSTALRDGIVGIGGGRQDSPALGRGE